MVPVCTADLNYRHLYDADTLYQLYEHFDQEIVEVWCDCRVPSGFVDGVGTGYDVALEMVEELDLDGAWGQCEATGELENGYAAGARRFVGSVDANVMDETWLARVSSGEILVTAELYRNKMPWMLPDWRGANAGIGGNTIACYASPPPPEGEGATYTPVAAYKDLNLYVPKQDSVYGVGLAAQDWPDLA